MAGAESGRTEQIVTNFVLKVLQAVLDSRVPHVVAGGRVGGGERARRRDRWFNLALGDPPAALEGLSVWHRGAADPMVVDVLLLRDGADVDAVIERWAVHYEPSASSSRPGTPLSSPSTPFRAAPPSPASVEAAASFYKRTYKKCIVLLRSIYSVLRLLPAYKAFRMLSSTTAGGGGSGSSSNRHHHAPQQNCNFNLSYRVSSFAEPFTRAEEEEMKRYDFTAVETQFGQITASVVYRPDLSEFNLESSSLFPPRIISDYVGSPAADPLRAFPSSPSSDTHPTSFPARGIIRPGPLSRPHSWTSTPLGHHPLSTSPQSPALQPQNSPIGIFGQRTVGGHRRPSAGRKGSMSFDDYALSPPFSPSPSPSPPTHSGSSLHRRLPSETAPVSIPSSAMRSNPLHHRSPNFSDPTRLYLPPSSSKVTRADTSFQESPESRSFRRVEGFKVGEFSPGFPGSSLQKGIRDVRDDSGRFSGVLSSCGSPRVGFSRSSSKLSFQDDLDDSCPFAVDDIPDSQLRHLDGKEASESAQAYMSSRTSQEAAVGVLVRMLRTAPPLRQDLSYSSQSSKFDPDGGGNSSSFFVSRKTSDALEELRSYKEMKDVLLSKSRSQFSGSSN